MKALGSVSLFPTPPVLCCQLWFQPRSFIPAPPGASPFPRDNSTLLGESLHSAGSAMNPRDAAGPERVLLQLLHSPARPRARGEAGAHPGHPDRDPCHALAQDNVSISLPKSQTAFLPACAPRAGDGGHKGLSSARLSSAQLSSAAPPALFCPHPTPP